MVIALNAPLAAWRQEAGGHRFQRVPPTERRGRVHTSTVTVTVSEAERVRATFDPSECRVEWFSGTGKGGQHRNKHQNSCRVFHDATGVSAKSECRSRENSYAEALAECERRVLAIRNGGLDLAESQERRAQSGTGMRGDKVRTYRLQDDVVTDNRTGKQGRWRHISRGNFEAVI